MGTTINVVCYKSKVLKNNESPLMVRICKDGKRKYESIGISLEPIFEYLVVNDYIIPTCFFSPAILYQSKID